MRPRPNRAYHARIWTSGSGASYDLYIHRLSRLRTAPLAKSRDPAARLSAGPASDTGNELQRLRGAFLRPYRGDVVGIPRQHDQL
jgi:hypothetical protein